MTNAERIQILGAIDNHENLKNSYCWGGDNGNGQMRTNREKKLNFTTTVDIDGHRYSYRSQVEISRKNFYYKGFFSKDGERGDVRLFKKLISN